MRAPDSAIAAGVDEGAPRADGRRPPVRRALAVERAQQHALRVAAPRKPGLAAASTARAAPQKTSQPLGNDLGTGGTALTPAQSGSIVPRNIGGRLVAPALRGARR
eukprot:scaffold130801_cov66-Phaeocystis_antarctica.AAC.1